MAAGSCGEAPAGGRAASTVPAWLVLFDCGHSRHPEAHHCAGDDEGHAPHDGPPPIGWSGWCIDCGDFRTTVDVVSADPLETSRDPLDGGQQVARPPVVRRFRKRAVQYARHPKYLMRATRNRWQGLIFDPVGRYRCCGHTTPHHGVSR